MRYNLLSIILLFVVFGSNAQLILPELSPDGKLEQQIGYTKFEISYGRPAARGRKIFGELVPYGLVWRTGGGAANKLRFDKDVTIAGKVIKAGVYTIVTIPNPDHWTILINSNTEKIFGDQQDKYDATTEVVRFDVPVKKTDRFYESFTFDLDAVNNNAELFISWENTQIHFPILTGSNALVLKQIETYLNANPADAENLSYAAYYLDMNNMVPQRLLAYIDRALKIEEKGWYYELKINLLAKENRFDEAQKTYQTAVAFLRKSKPEGWEEEEQHLTGMMKKLKK